MGIVELLHPAPWVAHSEGALSPQGTKYGVRIWLMLSSSHTNASHHCCSPLIFCKLFLLPVLESKGNFPRLGQNATEIFVREGKGKACPHILRRFGRLYKFRVVSLENRPNSSSISETLLSSSFITSFIEWQAPTSRNRRRGA